MTVSSMIVVCRLAGNVLDVRPAALGGLLVTEPRGLHDQSSSASRFTAGRVLDLDPVMRSARPIRRTKALGYDALTAKRASMLVDDRAVVGVMLIEADAGMRTAEQTRELVVANLNRLAA
jgi:hypothetical protein